MTLAPERTRSEQFNTTSEESAVRSASSYMPESPDLWPQNLPTSAIQTESQPTIQRSEKPGMHHIDDIDGLKQFIYDTPGLSSHELDGYKSFVQMKLHDFMHVDYVLRSRVEGYNEHPVVTSQLDDNKLFKLHEKSRHECLAVLKSIADEVVFDAETSQAYKFSIEVSDEGLDTELLLVEKYSILNETQIRDILSRPDDTGSTSIFEMSTIQRRQDMLDDYRNTRTALTNDQIIAKLNEFFHRHYDIYHDGYIENDYLPVDITRFGVKSIDGLSSDQLQQLINEYRDGNDLYEYEGTIAATTIDYSKVLDSMVEEIYGDRLRLAEFERSMVEESDQDIDLDGSDLLRSVDERHESTGVFTPRHLKKLAMQAFKSIRYK